MMKTKVSILMAAFLLPGAVRASETDVEVEDSADVMQELRVSGVKEYLPMRQQALSATTFGANTLKECRVQSLKDLSGMVPGLFIPHYGSRQITSMYMRGIGSRINTPAVGLYVDDVPWVDKSAFDVFLLDDVQGIQVLRGPQSTLYGRNAMGGLVRITTKNPLEYQGTDLYWSGAMYGDYQAGLTHYQHLSPQLGMTAGVSYAHRGGFYENVYTGRKVDRDDDLRARIRLVAQPTETVHLDFQTNYEYSRQGAYPYMLVSVPESDALADDLRPALGTIDYNREGRYTRHLLNTSLKAEHHWERIVLSNVLGFQFLKDDMDMDQDFTRKDIYTLRQQQSSQVLSEEIAIKSRPGAWKHWDWSTGISGFAQWISTCAPVSFRRDGVQWLNSLVNAAAAAHMPPVAAGPMTMTFLFDDHIQGDELSFPGTYRTPVLSGALYHQSTVRDLLSLRGLDLTVGLRLDYERVGLDYDTQYDFTHTYGLRGHLTGPRDLTINMVPAREYTVHDRFRDEVKNDYLQLLPRFSLQYRFPLGNVYGTLSRGYRSGGYNFQLFGDLLQGQMRARMMQDVATATIPVLQQQPQVPQSAKDQVTALLTRMAQQPSLDAQTTCLFRPEYAWNYEVGTHLDLWNRLQADLSLYMTRITDQQISQMAAGGLGRVTVNAGRSRSLGGEVSLRAMITERLSAHATYGYTHATFRNYQSDQISYRGHFVPFVPRNTIDLGARYMWMLRGPLTHLALRANWSGVGNIYWNESNQTKEAFYGTLGARLSLATCRGVEFSLWGKNLTDCRYRSFYFETMGRGFAQMGHPLQVGVDVRAKL